MKTLFHEVNGGPRKTIEAAVKEAFGHEHRTLQQAFFKNFIIPVIEEMAEAHDEGWIDLRNEAAGELAVKLREITKETALPFI